MSKNVNVLIVVEGKRTEPMFFKSLFNLYGLDYDVFYISANIYKLYAQMKEMDFNCDLKDALKTLDTQTADKELLDKKFAYTYLVFDCDIHHAKENILEEEKELEVCKNIDKLKEMLSYFTDETEPSKGKLYINYPMFESYKDSDNFFDEQYADRVISIELLSKYKEIVGERKLANVRLDKYTKDNFNDIVKMNLYKLSRIFTEQWKLPNYKEYLSLSENSKVVEKQREKVSISKELYVLHTSLFLMVDFFGNENSHYDRSYQ